MTYTFCEMTVSDLHKDAYGYRPSQGWWLAWNGMEAPEKQAEWDRLIGVLEEEQEYEVRREQRAFDAWSGRINDMIATHGISHRDAIMWDMDAEDADDVDHYCYLVGIGYHRAAGINWVLQRSE